MTGVQPNGHWITKCSICSKYMLECRHIVPVSVPQNLYHLKIKTYGDGSLRFPIMWEQIRRWELDKAHNSCFYCGMSAIILHEVWDYVEETGVQYLVGFRLVCFECNFALHPFYAKHVGHMKDAIFQMQMVNRLSPKAAVNIIYACMRLAKKRNKIKWKQDISYVNSYIKEQMLEVDKASKNLSVLNL